MIKKSIKIVALLLWSATITFENAIAQVDTLRLMAYNVLYYGDNPPCQGPHDVYHNYLKSIIAYSKPDIIGLEKMAAIPMFPGDNSGTAPTGFADSVLQFAFNAAIPATYNYCTYTNTSGADNINLLYYNKAKLGFAGILSSYSNITDFDTYKLYYKDVALATTHDTLFLYVTLNHDQSGSTTGNATTRGAQIGGYMDQLQSHYTRLNNLITMGDFNTHNSSEPCYQRLVAPSDTNYLFYDPPFYPDALFTYPADWDNNPSTYATCLTTSTRLSGSVPNSCGTSGGGKSWYDHIFLASSIIHNTDRIKYIPHSYSTLGNDGNRVGISINDAPTNTSAPSDVINSLFQMSNKYPIIADLLIGPHTASVIEQELTKINISVINPVHDKLIVYLSGFSNAKTISVECFDLIGQSKMKCDLQFYGEKSITPIDLPSGNYLLRFTEGKQLLKNIIVSKD